MVHKYIGKICPFCKSEFKEDDEIVVCSGCDMPHHKECWVENQGCTTFGCLGSIKSVDGMATSVTATEISFDDIPQTNNSIVYCTQCGLPNSNSASFCSMCGSRLITSVWEQQTYGQYNDNVYTQQVTIDNDVVQLIGTTTEYYVSKFQEMKLQNKKTTWNWPAFLATPYWFIYRKMYGYGYGILAAAFVLSLISNLSFFALVGYIVFGIYANYIYMIELEKKADQVKAMNEPFKSQYIFKNGSTDISTTVLTVIGYVILLGLIFA